MESSLPEYAALVKRVVAESDRPLTMIEVRDMVGLKVPAARVLTAVDYLQGQGDPIQHAYQTTILHGETKITRSEPAFYYKDSDKIIALQNTDF